MSGFVAGEDWWKAQFESTSSALDQVVEWKEASWLNEFAADQEACTVVRGLARSYGELIPRRAMYEAARNVDEGSQTVPVAPLRAALITAMVWGFGPSGYGPYRTRKMLGTSNVFGILYEIAETARSCGDAPSIAFSSLFSHGRTRVSWLGVSFGTKLLHAFGHADTGVQPVIYDQFVYKGLTCLASTHKVSGLPRHPHPWRFMSTESYQDICRWIADVAQDVGRPPRDIEYALFLLGKGVFAS